MDDARYEHVTALDDPAKPWRKVWRCTAHTPPIYVKSHAPRDEAAAALGKLSWRITVSACDENGKALQRADGSPAILSRRTKPYTKRFHVAHDADPAELEPIAVRMDREIKFMIAQVEFAVLNERQAIGL